MYGMEDFSMFSTRTVVHSSKLLWCEAFFEGSPLRGFMYDV